MERGGGGGGAGDVGVPERGSSSLEKCKTSTQFLHICPLNLKDSVDVDNTRAYLLPWDRKRCQMAGTGRGWVSLELTKA